MFIDIHVDVNIGIDVLVLVDVHLDVGDDADVYVGHNVYDNFVSIETLSKAIY